MKDRVDEAHGCGELETEGGRRYPLENLEGPKSLVVQFLGRSGGLDVLCVKPNFLAGSERVGDRRSVSVGRSLVLRLCDSELFLAVVVKFGELVGKVVGGLVADGDVEGESGARIVSVVGKER